jgi:hypothetical protein
MKYGLFAAIAFAFVALIGGAASAGVATSGLTNATVAPSASIVQEADWKGRKCYRRCRAHGHSRWRCRKRCGFGSWW